MGVHRDIEVKQIFDAASVGVSGALSSSAFDLGSFGQQGQFSLEFNLGATGATVDAIYEVSNSGTSDSFITPSDATTIVVNFDRYSGPNGDGKDIVPFTPVLARFIRIRVNEIGGEAGASVTAWLAMQ